MSTEPPSEPGQPEGLLSIGDLAERTGLTAPTLRVWEQRHGFPVAHRLPSGHRRYHPGDVESIRLVLEQRNQGMRLEAAIATVQSLAEPPTRSIFAEMRRANPTLPVHRLCKATLIAMSWAIEDEFAAQARRPRLYGAFQAPRYYEASRTRWEHLARLSESTTVLARFDALADGQRQEAGRGRPALVGLGPDSPLLDEWAVIVATDDLPVALTAWEIPGQDDVPEHAREFECVWSLEPADVDAAERAVLSITGEPAPPAAHGGGGDPTARAAAAAALYARMISYVDRRLR